MIVGKSVNLGPVSRVFEDKIIIDQLASEKFYHISCKNYVVRNWPAHQCAPLQPNVSVADGARVGANLRGVIAG